jgi:hypothetical protein
MLRRATARNPPDEPRVAGSDATAELEAERARAQRSAPGLPRPFRSTPAQEHGPADRSKAKGGGKVFHCRTNVWFILRPPVTARNVPVNHHRQVRRKCAAMSASSAPVDAHAR